MEIDRVELPRQTYAYIETRCAISGPAIADAMARGFGDLFAWLGAEGIAPLSPPMAVYPGMPDREGMTLRCAALIPEAVAARAPVGIDTLPEGPALTALHIGAYASMNRTHDALWTEARAKGLVSRMPVWEIYEDDPGDVPEERLRTRILHPVERA